MPIGYESYQRLISRVLTMYYDEGLNQAQVAKALGLSTAKVNRLLKQAREQGMVEISIRTPFQHLTELERRLQKTFDVRDAVVIPELSSDVDVAVQSVGRAAAGYLLDKLRDGDVIAISGGKALSAMVQSIETQRRYEVEVVPATGGYQGRHFYDVNYLAAQLAERLGGQAYQLHAPVLVDTPREQKTVISLSPVRAVLDKARKAQIAIVGIGSVAAESSSYFELPSMHPDDKRRIIGEYGGASEILACICNERGEPCAPAYNQRVVGLTPAELRAISLRIGVSVSQSKILPIRAALRGKYLTTIITDEATAAAVLDEERA